MELTNEYLEYLNTLLKNNMAIATVKFQSNLFNTTIDVFKLDYKSDTFIINIKLFNKICVKKLRIKSMWCKYDNVKHCWDLCTPSMRYLGRLEIYNKQKEIEKFIDGDKVTSLYNLFTRPNLKCAYVSQDGKIVTIGNVYVNCHNYNRYIPSMQHIISIDIRDKKNINATEINIYSNGIDIAYNTLIRDKKNYIESESSGRLYVDV